jgi:hypothetical protein
MSGSLQLTGYRPLMTRSIGRRKPSGLKPIDDAAGPASHAAPREPPELCFSNFEAYEADEVLLDDLSASDEPPFPLPPARPLAQLGGVSDLCALRIRITSDAPPLPQPSALAHGGHVYTFDGLLLIAPAELRPLPPPPAEAVLGSLVHSVTFHPTPVPPCLDSAAERSALDQLQPALYQGLLGVQRPPDADVSLAMPIFIRRASGGTGGGRVGGGAGADGVGGRVGDGVGGGAGGEAGGNAPSGEAGIDDGNMLPPSAILAAVRAPMPLVSEWADAKWAAGPGAAGGESGKHGGAVERGGTVKAGTQRARGLGVESAEEEMAGGTRDRPRPPQPQQPLSVSSLATPVDAS